MGGAGCWVAPADGWPQAAGVVTKSFSVSLKQSERGGGVGCSFLFCLGDSLAFPALPPGSGRTGKVHPQNILIIKCSWLLVAEPQHSRENRKPLGAKSPRVSKAGSLSGGVWFPAGSGVNRRGSSLQPGLDIGLAWLLPFGTSPLLSLSSVCSVLALSAVPRCARGLFTQQGLHKCS